ncbi:sugar transferase [Simkania negevensis]|uniref:Sugar transferase n=1 Tax=Simkania negevensis TaxID=83561 RepID=A0ABS3AQM8_9BACT|nr:sugar transferase [Simkania negevensis]
MHTVVSSVAPSRFTKALRYAIRQRVRKRIFDLLFSATVLVTLSPLFLFLALLVCCTSRGAPFYSHTRIGRGGRPFRIWKFRSMYKDADGRLATLLAKDDDLRLEWESTQKLKKDPRVTKVGRFLRRISLDELPQFFNVLKGNMSVVGPRPLLAKEITQHFGLHATKVLSVRPGLTGLWQISGRSNTTYEERVSLDLTYINKATFFSDLILVLKTIPVMLFSRGAY